MGGLEVLVNLLETKDIKCQLGSLAVLLQLATSSEMRKALIDLDIVTPLINILKHPARDLQVMAAETMANIAMMRKARKQIRIRNGIPLIVSRVDEFSPIKVTYSFAIHTAGHHGCARLRAPAAHRRIERRRM